VSDGQDSNPRESSYAASLPVLVLESDTTVVFASRSAHELLGVDLTRRAFSDLLDEGDRESVCAAVAEGEPWIGPVRFTDAVEGSFQVQIVGRFAAPASDGELVLVELGARVETPQRLVELEAAHQRSMALLEAMPDLLFRISSDLTFLDYRDPTLAGLGVAPEDFLGKRLDEFLPPEITDLVAPNLREALETDRTVTYASHYDYEDGRHTFDNRVVKSGDQEVVLICRDTTEQTRAVQALQRNQARFQRIVELSREYTAITDENEIITFVSAPVEQILGYRPDEMVGMPWVEMVHPDDLTAFNAPIADRRELIEERPVRLRLRMKNGGYRDIEATTKVLLDDELVGGLLTHCRDITDYVAVEDSLRESLARLDAIVDTAAEGILTLSLDGTVQSLNRAARKMFRLGDDGLDQVNVGSIFTEESHSLVMAAMRDATATLGASLHSLPSELACMRTDGTTFPVSASMSSIERENEIVFAAIVRDDSERRALERQLEYQATHDALTGLPNRNLFMVNLERAIRRSAIEHRHVAVLFLDLDRFKIDNDSLGHAAGDRLLGAVATRLTTAVRGDATVARFGGDEFLVLCPDLEDPRDVKPIVNRVLGVLRESIDIGGETSEEVFVSASAGVAVYRPDLGVIEPEVMVRNADVALYRAKELGRGRFEIFDWLDSSKNQNRLSTETALRHAIARDELLVHYQPVWSMSQHRFAGTEALIRWNHDGVLIAPARFIPIAEESDLIVDIGLWVLRRACAQTAKWRLNPLLADLTVAVNVSGRQLDRHDFPATVRAVLEESGLDPSALTLEITETRLVHDDEATLAQLHELKSTGVRVAIDDFGTGYSSLGYLRNLPVDIIKLDRCFTSQLEHDRHTHEIVRTITTLAHTLGMTVVAEGVESDAQLSALYGLSCDHAQGFLLARPAPSDEVGPVLITQSGLDNFLPRVPHVPMAG
jgi:Amt family ammonium transporter